MNGFLAVLLGVGFVVLLFWFIVVQARQTRENFTRLAGTLGLKPDEAKPVLGVFLPAPRAQGLIDGRTMELSTFTKGSGKSRTDWCGLRVRLQLTRPVEFDLSPEGLSHRVLGWFGVKEITVGNKLFDDAFLVRTSAPELFTAALVPDIQTKLLAAHQAGVRGTFKLEQGALTYTEQGSFASQARCGHFEKAMEILRDLAVAAEVMGGS